MPPLRALAFRCVELGPSFHCCTRAVPPFGVATQPILEGELVSTMQGGSSVEMELVINLSNSQKPRSELAPGELPSFLDVQVDLGPGLGVKFVQVRCPSLHWVPLVISC